MHLHERALVASLVLAFASSASSAQRAAPPCARDTSLVRLLPNYPVPPEYPRRPQPPDSAIHNMCNVDQPARIDPSPAPLYPPLLATARVGGEVLLQFIVLANGRIDSASVHVIRSTHDLFTKEVRRVVLSWHAKSARYRGTAVKQLVEYELQFETACRGAEPEVRPPSSEPPVSGSVRICLPH